MTDFAVSVVMERRMRRQGRWSYPLWTMVGVVAGRLPDMASASRHRVRVGEDGAEQFIWCGLRVSLHRDAAERYWHNLVGVQPSLFVICRADPEGELAPCAVSADSDEASAHMETDGTVFAAPIPPAMRLWMEQYVMANYHPAQPEGRRRKRHREDSDHAAR